MSESSDRPNANPSFYAHSRKLFVFSNGEPIMFSMEPCEAFSEIKGMIEHGGGSINSDMSKDCIRLAKSGNLGNHAKTVDCKYVYDCVRWGRLLNLQGYYFHRKTDLSSDEEFSSQTSISSKQPRKSFSHEDDMTILEHICKHGLHLNTRGTLLWKNMEKKKILKGRTWHSLSNRFRKTIRKNLFNYIIPEADKLLLEQIPERSKNKSEERVRLLPSKGNAWKRRTVENTAPLKHTVKRPKLEEKSKKSEENANTDGTSSSSVAKKPASKAKTEADKIKNIQEKLQGNDEDHLSNADMSYSSISEKLTSKNNETQEERNEEDFTKVWENIMNDDMEDYQASPTSQNSVPAEEDEKQERSSSDDIIDVTNLEVVNVEDEVSRIKMDFGKQLTELLKKRSQVMKNIKALKTEKMVLEVVLDKEVVEVYEKQTKVSDTEKDVVEMFDNHNEISG